MFEDLWLLGSQERDIPLYTRLRSRVRNSQAQEPDDRSLQKFDRLLAQHRRWELRKAACGTYNCFGHVWASRRTAIYEQSEIEIIRRDDGYRLLGMNETPRPGDLAVYCDSQEQSIYHVGVVCELRLAVALDDRPQPATVPWILSKLDDASGEVVHHMNDMHLPDGFTVNFWTDRPEPHA